MERLNIKRTITVHGVRGVHAIPTQFTYGELYGYTMDSKDSTDTIWENKQ